MKNFILLFSLSSVLCSAIVIPSKVENVNHDKFIFKDLSQITVGELIKLKPSDIQGWKGVELLMKEKFVLSLMQHELRKSVKKKLVDENTVVDFNQYFEAGKSNFSIGGFFMGLLFSIIGVGLAHLVTKDYAFRRSSWKGFAISLILILVFILA